MRNSTMDASYGSQGYYHACSTSTTPSSASRASSTSTITSFAAGATSLAFVQSFSTKTGIGPAHITNNALVHHCNDDILVTMLQTPVHGSDAAGLTVLSGGRWRVVLLLREKVAEFKQRRRKSVAR